MALADEASAGIGCHHLHQDFGYGGEKGNAFTILANEVL